MANNYHERVHESQVFVDYIASFEPAAMSQELIEEGHRFIAIETSGRSRQLLSQSFDIICDPEARQAVRSRQTEANLFGELEGWLADLAISPEGEVRSVREIYDDTAIFGTEERAHEWKETKQALAREEAVRTMKVIDTLLSNAEFGVNFGENKYGHAWESNDTLEAVREIMRFEKNLGMAHATDRIRSLLESVDPSLNKDVVRLLIINADVGNDRPSFIAASERFMTMALGRWPVDVFPTAKPLFDLAIHFIEAGKPHELDRQALEIALKALPFYDRIAGSYPLMCARLGVALQGFEQD